MPSPGRLFMRRWHFISLFLLSALLGARATLFAQQQPALIDLSHEWSAHDGDNPAWAASGFNSFSWESIDLDNMGPAQPGWRWFRRQISLGPDHSNLSLLLEGSEGAYEIYVNGNRLPGAALHSAFNVSRPTEQVFTLHDPGGNYIIALRTHAPANFADYKLPLFLSATIGEPAAIEYQRAALQAARLDALWPSLAINLLLCAAGIGALLLFLFQRSHRDYLYLGLYLFVLGASNGLWNLQQSGVAPTSLNILGSDPLIYVYTILQIEFTFSFVGKRPNAAMRVYQAVLLLPLVLIGFCWTGHLPSDVYSLVEAAVTIPVAFILTTLLVLWYRRGNREAGWLIFPSLLPLIMGGLFDLGFTSIVLGWGRFDFLDSFISIGLLQFQPTDLANLLFLIAIAVVMFFRFTRVSRDQARAEAELSAAREVQQRLVPPPVHVPGFQVESAYLPATQVGGDFYYLRAGHDGSLLAIVGDVSGKGLPAAMAVSAIVGALRTMPDLAPSKFLDALNRGLSGELRHGFVTCCAVRITRDGRVTLASAGHLPPYCNGSEIEFAPALPLGLSHLAEYPEVNFLLGPDDQLTLMTDGVVEARNARGELFGFDRTRAISTQSAEAIARAAQAHGQEDDITVLTLTRLSPASAHAPQATCTPGPVIA